MANQRNKEKEIEKVESYLKKNEDALTQKIISEEKRRKEKYNKLRRLEAFTNPVFNIFNQVVKDYEFNLVNSKVSNQEVFFNTPEHDLSTSKFSKKVNYINYYYFLRKLLPEAYH